MVDSRRLAPPTLRGLVDSRRVAPPRRTEWPTHVTSPVLYNPKYLTRAHGAARLDIDNHCMETYA